MAYNDENNPLQTIEKSSAEFHGQAPGISESLKKQHILLVNLLGFTRLTPQRDQRELDDIQQTFSAIVNSSVAIFRGHVVKNAGYAYLVTFDAAADVLRAGLKIEQGVDRYNAKEGKVLMEVKIAINTDEPVSEDWDDTIKEASRPAATVKIMPKTKPAVVEDTVITLNALTEEKPYREVKTAPSQEMSNPLAETRETASPEPKPALANEKFATAKTRRLHSHHHEIKIPVPDYAFETYRLGVAAAKYDVFKSRDRKFAVALLLAGFAVMGLRITWVSYPVIPEYIKEAMVEPANFMSNYVESEFIKDHIPDILKNHFESSVAPARMITPRPEPEITTVKVVESEIPSTVKMVPPQPAATTKTVSIIRRDPPVFAQETFKEGLELEKWYPSHSDEATVDINFMPQAQGQAVQIKYDLGVSGGWVQIHRALWIEKLEKEAILFYYRATGSINDLEIKMTDDDGTNYGYRLTFNPDGDWHRVKIPFQDFTYWWGGNSTLSYASKLYFAVSPGVGGSGEIMLDNIRVVWAE